jgi:drug/metabolite transporter (DMT)-like permease
MTDLTRGVRGGTAADSTLLPTLAALAVVLFWGMSFVSSKAILNTGFPPLSMALARFAVASLVLALLRRRLEPGKRFDARERLLLAASGFFGVSVYFFFETRGIKLTNASNAALIIATIPVFTVAAEHFFFRNPIRWMQGVGIALSILGVYLIVGPGEKSLPGATIGNLFMLGACLSWVAYMSLSRRLHTAAPRNLSLTAWQNLAGAAFMLPFALTESRGWFLPGPVIWLNILYLALFCSALGYFLYQFALARLGPVRVSAYLNLVPVVGSLGGVIVLGEALAPLQALGGLVVVAGIFLVNLRRS